MLVIGTISVLASAAVSAQSLVQASLSPSAACARSATAPPGRTVTDVLLGTALFPDVISPVFDAKSACAPNTTGIITASSGSSLDYWLCGNANPNATGAGPRDCASRCTNRPLDVAPAATSPCTTGLYKSVPSFEDAAKAAKGGLWYSFSTALDSIAPPTDIIQVNEYASKEACFATHTDDDGLSNGGPAFIPGPPGTAVNVTRVILIPIWHWPTPIAGTSRFIVTDDVFHLGFDTPSYLQITTKICQNAKCTSWTSVDSSDYLSPRLWCNGQAMPNGAFRRLAGRVTTPAGIAAGKAAFDAMKADAEAENAAIDAEIEAEKSFWQKNSSMILISATVGLVVAVGGIVAWKRGLFGAKKQPQTDASA